MPAIREVSSARPNADCSRLSTALNQSIVPASSLPQARSLQRGKTAARKKKPANAFILFRSYVLQHNLLPSKIHQNDVSIEVARLWRDATPEFRSQFFYQAELVKTRRDNEQLPEESGVRLGCSQQISTAIPHSDRQSLHANESFNWKDPSSNAQTMPPPVPLTWRPQSPLISSRQPPAVTQTNVLDLSGPTASFLYCPPAVVDPIEFEFDWSADLVASDVSLHPETPY